MLYYVVCSMSLRIGHVIADVVCLVLTVTTLVCILILTIFKVMSGFPGVWNSFNNETKIDVSFYTFF